jgi:hypothetical protein
VNNSTYSSSFNLPKVLQLLGCLSILMAAFAQVYDHKSVWINFEMAAGVFTFVIATITQDLFEKRRSGDEDPWPKVSLFLAIGLVALWGALPLEAIGSSMSVMDTLLAGISGFDVLLVVLFYLYASGHYFRPSR